MISGVLGIICSLIVFFFAIFNLVDGFDWYYLLMILASASGMYWSIVHIVRAKDAKQHEDKES